VSGLIATKALGNRFSPAKRTHHKLRVPKADDTDVATRFTTEIKKELGAFLKASVLFGSCATGTAHDASDIDVLLIIDDVTHPITDELTLHYQQLVTKTAAQISKRLHLNTLKLSNFFEYCREGDPVIISMLRDGHVLHDTGFFLPAQLLLQQGRIRPSKEAIWTYYARPENTLRSARKHILSACVDLYWAAIDSSHAALMTVGQVPASPDHVPELLERALVQRGLLPAFVPKVVRELYQLQKSITHRELKEVTGHQYEAYWTETLKAVDALRTVVERKPPA
jgi:predicted nucleotidyltransferase